MKRSHGKSTDAKTGRFIFLPAVILALVLSLSACAGTSATEPASAPEAKTEESVVSTELEAKEEEPVVSTEPEAKTEESVVSTEPEAKTEESLVSPELEAAAEIPEYSGEAYTAINDNIPFFDKTNLSTESFEYYSELDSLGRCQAAYANIGQDLMPEKEREGIGQIKPTGWQTVKYDNIDGKYLYNRCHLIGYQLSAENANEKNLITGTRYLNVVGMLPFENMVADYVKETGNHVLYRVTPVFDGDNLLADGVLMEGWSVEDEGDGICFNVFAYNVQPDIVIDYANGDSCRSEDAADGGPALAKASFGQEQDNLSMPASEEITEEETTEEEAESRPAGTDYILNTNTHKFHYPSCVSVGQMAEKNKAFYMGTRDEVIGMGYEPCKKCSP